MIKGIVGLLFLLALGGCGTSTDMAPAERVALFKAVEAGDVTMLEKALNAGITPNLYDEERGYLIHDAVGRGNARALKMLIEAGADVNARTEGAAPIVLAMLGGSCEEARMLLLAGAKDDTRFTIKAAAAAAAPPDYGDKTARELYFVYKRKFADLWSQNKACWLEVEKLMN